ncbi:MAG: permease [Hyphomicrobiales bacterium]|nr:permease [Hyphomicrobiales bacterium]
MTELVLYARERIFTPGWNLWRKEPVWIVFAGILLAVFLLNPSQGIDSATFVAGNFLDIVPFLLFSVLIAAYISATDAEGLIVRAFSGSAMLMIVLASVAGGISPLCSCGVIPLMAALLRMGVPLSAVMAFCLASPVMDPSMFALTAGILGSEFAVAKTLAAIGIGLLGGFAGYGLERAGYLRSILREEIAGGCGSGECDAPLPRDAKASWRFWRERERLVKFRTQSMSTSLFLARWLSLAFLLESLMLVYVPAELVTSIVGGAGWMPIVTATIVGVPTYMNGYASLPLIGGLLQQGMSPGAAMAFIVAGSVTSIPAAIAVWALVKPRGFLFYVTAALIGSFSVGILFQLWSSVY